MNGLNERIIFRKVSGQRAGMGYDVPGSLRLSAHDVKVVCCRVVAEEDSPSS
nr:hypothetical protein [Escherichia coli O25b:H4-ST131]